MDVRKFKTNLAIIIILLTIIGGYAFFMLSPRLFDVDDSNLLYTPISEEVKINNEHSVSVEGWQYSEREAKMGVILALNSTSANPSEEYVYQIMSRNKAKEKNILSYDVTYQSSTFVTLTIIGVPKDFVEIAVRVGYINKHLEAEGKPKDVRAEYTSVFTNKNKVEKTDTIEELSVVEIYIDKIEKENKEIEDVVTSLQDDNKSLETQKQDILSKVSDLRKSELYLTESEKSNLYNQISSYQSVYDGCQKEIESNSKKIVEQEAILTKNRRKIAELQNINSGGEEATAQPTTASVETTHS